MIECVFFNPRVSMSSTHIYGYKNETELEFSLLGYLSFAPVYARGRFLRCHVTHNFDVSIIIF